MPLELELPQQVETSPGRAVVELSQEKEAAKAGAAAALDAAESAESEPQREGSMSVTVRLTRAVEDATSAFSAVAGDTFDGYVDTDGSTWLPLLSGDIMLEPEEFEIVQPLAGQEANASPELISVVADQSGDWSTPVPKSEPEPEPSFIDEIRKRERYLREKSGLEEHICALGIEIGRAKETIKSCKKEQEVLLEKLDNLITSWEHPPAAAIADGCGHVQADQPAAGHAVPAEPISGPPGDPHVSQPQSSQPQSSQPQSSQPLESYQSVLESEPLAALGLKEAVAAKLIEGGVETLWQLEMLRKDISEGRKEWPKGIGKAKVTLIEDAILTWCAANSGRWDRQQGANDQAEAKADAERAEAVKESQPPIPEPGPEPTPKLTVSADIDDL